ncbi:tetratricopeptide repeat protein [Belliella aquatica]|uniref:J domain-containing protein n=1 Tax=Belliella aquatica TaxID=1323734 RepID=A0ABQ1MWP8_9BACT|nr:tetratricopeptide repeat protein [Belliella aquatica]MCH7406806.1 SEL1-like repeat protein [Belliella aquatica]GGC48300.1 hypothetical protein GCM10010993_28490 [Belliella aquatica]
MNIKKALELLDLEENASKQEIRKAYQELYNDMQVRITNVPDSLRQKYIERLKQIDEAYQVLGGTLEDDVSDLPSTGPIENESSLESNPAEVTISSAKDLLGIQGEFFLEDLKNIYQERKAELEASMQEAPLKNIKKAYESTLKELDQSYALLKLNAKKKNEPNEDKSKVSELKQAYETLGVSFGTEYDEVKKAYQEKRKELVYIINNRKDDFAKAASKELTLLEQNVSLIIPDLSHKDKYPEKNQAKAAEIKNVYPTKKKNLLPVLLGVSVLILVVVGYLFLKSDESKIESIEIVNEAVPDSDLDLADTITDINSEETSTSSTTQITQTAESSTSSSSNNAIIVQAMQAYNNLDYKKAIDLFQTAARQNVAEAYTMLGFTYYWGDGWGSVNYQKGKESFEKALSLGDLKANYGLGLQYNSGNGVTKNPRTAQDFFRKSFNAVQEKSKQGDDFWMQILSAMYRNGWGVTKNLEEGIRLLKIGDSNQNARAQLNLGYAYHYGEGVLQNHQEAVRLYRLAANKGQAVAEFNLGVMYRDGTGVSKDDREAYNWFLKSAQKGFSNAQNEIGRFYENGWHVSKNENEAFNWYKKAAAQNSQYGLFNLGRFYFNGIAITRNDEEAYKYFKSAADRGHTGSMSFIGAMYDYGFFLESNWEKAFEFYKKGEESGYYLRQLGEMYFFGVGGAPKNEILAMEYFKKSNDNWSKVYMEVIPKLGKEKYFEASNNSGDKISLTTSFSSPVVMGKLGNNWTEKVSLSFNAASRARVWPIGNANSGGENPKDEIIYSNYSSSEEFTSNTEKLVSVSSKTPRRTIGYYYVTATFNTGDVQLKIPMAFAWKPE